MEAQPAAPAASWPELVVLRDGSEVFMRPIEPDDKDALARGFQALSPESRYRRFLTPMQRLSAKLLAYLTEVDHHSHEALVAETVAEHELVGVARYIRLDDEPETAEVAVTVVDHWQAKGVATALLTRLAQHARSAGIERFRATCLAENRDMLDILENLGTERRQSMDAGVVVLDIELPALMEPERPLRVALRRAASGALVFRHPRLPGQRRAKRTRANR